MSDDAEDSLYRRRLDDRIGPMTRQQRRAQERAEAKRRVHTQVEASDSIQQLWRVYYRTRFELQTTRPFEPEMIALLQEVFYAGVASMFQLMNKASEGGETEADIDAGADKLQRLYEELDTFVKGLR